MESQLLLARARHAARAFAPLPSRVALSERLGSRGDVLNVVEWFRYATDLLMLQAGRLLPLRAALLVADGIGALDLLLPTRAGRDARSDIAAATGQRGWRGLRLAARRLSVPRQRLVYCARAAAGRDTLESWRTSESGMEPLRRLQAEGRSFVLAGVHPAAPQFLRILLLGGSDPFRVRADPKWVLSPFVVRSRLVVDAGTRARARLLGVPREGTRMFERARLALTPNWWRRDQDWSSVPERTAGVQESVLAKLAEPGAVVLVVVDAYWDKPSAHRRQFAGSPARGFALGAARMARLARCPVVPYVAVLGEEPLTAHLECGPVIEPPAIDDKAADVRTTDEALDWLERAVGRHPTQYGDRIGSARRWDAGLERWV